MPRYYLNVLYRDHLFFKQDRDLRGRAILAGVQLAHHGTDPDEIERAAETLAALKPGYPLIERLRARAKALRDVQRDRPTARDLVGGCPCWSFAAVTD